MRLDFYTLGAPLGEVGALAADVEKAGFDGLWFAETAHHAFLPTAAAALATSTVTVGTDVAVAFARSPMVTAQASWDLAEASDGRFVLGLGSQVRAHVERRFSAPYSSPVERLREYVLSLRAIWTAFQNGGRLRFDGDFYSFSLLPDFFSPGPIEQHDIPVYLAGVNRGMAKLAGEVGQGFHAHPLHTTRYLTEVVDAAITAGAAEAGRTASDVCLVVPVFIAVGDDERDLHEQRESIRRQISFYASTPSYRTVFATHGWGEAADELARLQRQGDSGAMTAVVTDEMLDELSVTASWDELPARLHDRYDGVADRVLPYGQPAGWNDPATRDRWSSVARAINSGPVRASVYC